MRKTDWADEEAERLCDWADRRRDMTVEEDGEPILEIRYVGDITRFKIGSAYSTLARANGDPGVFGVMVADAAQHIANSLVGLVGRDGAEVSRDEIFARIREVLLLELDNPSQSSRRVFDA